MEFKKFPRAKLPAARTAAELAIDVGAQIKTARVKRGLRQTELAERMDTAPSVLARVEKGKTLPSLDFILRAATALDTGVVAPSFESLLPTKLEAEVKAESPSFHHLHRPFRAVFSRRLVLISGTPQNTVGNTVEKV